LGLMLAVAVVLGVPKPSPQPTLSASGPAFRWALDNRNPTAPGLISRCPKGQRGAAERECLDAVYEAPGKRVVKGFKVVNDGPSSMVPSGCSYSHSSKFAVFNRNSEGRSHRGHMYQLACIDESVMFYKSRLLDDGTVKTSHNATIGKLQDDGKTVVGEDGKVVGIRNKHGGGILMDGATAHHSAIFMCKEYGVMCEYQAAAEKSAARDVKTKKPESKKSAPKKSETTSGDSLIGGKGAGTTKPTTTKPATTKPKPVTHDERKPSHTSSPLPSPPAEQRKGKASKHAKKTEKVKQMDEKKRPSKVGSGPPECPVEGCHIPPSDDPWQPRGPPTPPAAQFA